MGSSMENSVSSSVLQARPRVQGMVGLLKGVRSCREPKPCFPGALAHTLSPSSALSHSPLSLPLHMACAATLRPPSQATGKGLFRNPGALGSLLPGAPGLGQTRGLPSSSFPGHAQHESEAAPRPSRQGTQGRWAAFAFGKGNSTGEVAYSEEELAGAGLEENREEILSVGGGWDNRGEENFGFPAGEGRGGRRKRAEGWQPALVLDDRGELVRSDADSRELERRKKIGEANRGKVPWNKGRSWGEGISPAHCSYSCRNCGTASVTL